MMKRWAVMLWASFLSGGVAEVLFFTVIDPGQLYFFGYEVELGPLATYSLGFLFFWLLALASSALSLFLLMDEEEVNRDAVARR
jgi:hypothetical protein